jgi:hypothetical protein
VPAALLVGGPISLPMALGCSRAIDEATLRPSPVGVTTDQEMQASSAGAATWGFEIRKGSRTVLSVISAQGLLCPRRQTSVGCHEIVREVPRAVIRSLDQRPRAPLAER